MSGSHISTVLRTRRFLPLLLAQILGGFNDNLLKNAMIGLITYEVLSLWGLPASIALPIAASVFTLPFILFSALAGQLADKYDRGLVLRRVKFFEILIAIIAALGFLLDSIECLLVALLAIGVQSAFFTPARNSVLPQWLRDEELITGNALIKGLLFVFILLGTVTGLALFKTENGAELMSVIMIGFAVMGWLFMCQAPDAPAPEPELEINHNAISSTLSMLKLVNGHKPVLYPLLGAAWFWGISALVLTLIPTYIKATLGYNETVLLFLILIFVIGAFIGSLACSVLASSRDAIGLSVIGIFGIALFTSDLFVLGLNADVNLAFKPILSPHGQDLFTTGEIVLGTLKDFHAAPRSSRFIVDLFGAALSAGLFVVPLQALSQRRADPDLRARLLCSGAIINALATTSFQLVLIALPYFGIAYHIPFFIIALLSLLIGFVMLFRLIAPAPNKVKSAIERIDSGESG